jgi:hypothetical protein
MGIGIAIAKENETDSNPDVDSDKRLSLPKKPFPSGVTGSFAQRASATTPTRRLVRDRVMNHVGVKRAIRVAIDPLQQRPGIGVVVAYRDKNVCRALVGSVLHDPILLS